MLCKEVLMCCCTIQNASYIPPMVFIGKYYAKSVSSDRVWV